MSFELHRLVRQFSLIRYEKGQLKKIFLPSLTPRIQNKVSLLLYLISPTRSNFFTLHSCLSSLDSSNWFSIPPSVYCPFSGSMTLLSHLPNNSFSSQMISILSSLFTPSRQLVIPVSRLTYTHLVY